MSPMLLMSAGAFAMFGMCCVTKYAPLWLAIPVNFFIWFATARLCGVT